MSGIIDCGVLHSWADPLELLEFLPPGWREYMVDHMPRQWHDHFVRGSARPPGVIGTTPLDYDLAYRDPLGDYAEDVRVGTALAACSSYEELRDRHLDPSGIDAALLCHGIGMLVPVLPVPRLTFELTRAINAWTIERWLARDPRLLGTILVATQLPEQAAREIRRLGRDGRVQAVLLGANGLGKPFGHPVYHPIFEAAVEMGLAVVIRAGGDETVETAAHPAAGGMPGTHAEHRTLAPQSLATHAASIIGQGLTNRLPELRVLLIGGSVAWITPFLWRFDTEFKAFRHDMLWLREPPSEVFQRHFLVGTGPFVLDAAGDRLAEYLEIDHRLGDVVCYASGFPEREHSRPAETQARLPSAWADRVAGGNARRALGGADRPLAPPPSRPTMLERRLA